ncbi:hypothetical protein [Actinomadura sp. 3N407]|uniref:hypothetical protein n=1 Tax=Actinomadura sp. 3N407 TaxID=3457423 RepID=UPI003FCCF5E5
MPHHRLRAGHALGLPAVLVLALTMGCGPNQETGTAPAKTATAPATGSSAATSNGVEKLAAAEILDRARKATASAKSLRMRGRLEEGSRPFTLDFRYAGKTKATGWFKQGEERVEIIRIGDTVYLKGNDAFWKSIGGKGAVQLFTGKYLKTTADNADFEQLAAFTDRSSLLNEVLKAVPQWERGKTGTAGGVPAVALTSAAGDQIQIATRGRPYVLSLDGGPENRLEYLAYDQPVDVRRPPAGAVVDADEME